MPPDSKATELTKSKNKLAELESALKEQKKIAGKLKETHEKKVYEINLIDKEIKTENEQYRWAKAKFENRIKEYEEDSYDKIKDFMFEEKELETETGGFEDLERENDRLHIKFKELIQEKETLEEIYLDQISKRNDRDFTTRMQMEEILRKVVRSNDKNYNKDAIEKMVFEASLADVENYKIRSEFSTREKQTNALIKKQERSLDMLKKMIIEKELVESSANYQRAEVSKINEINDELSIANGDLLDSIQKLSTEISDMKQNYYKLKATADQLSALRANLTSEKKRKEETTEATVVLCQKILTETLDMAEKLRLTYCSRVSHMIAHKENK